MKYLAILFLLFLLNPLMAINDTITLAQAYNFNIGDTFDYRIASQSYVNYNFGYAISFERDVIVNLWTDSSLHIVKHIHTTIPNQADYLDTIVVNSLNQYAFYSDTMCSTATYLPAYCYINTSSEYNGRLLNGNSISCMEAGTYENGFCPGLGQVYYDDSYSIEPGTNDAGNGTDSNFLIYFAKGSETWGAPYYMADGSNLVNFTPIPETCAIWTDTVPSWENYPGITAVEQIKTGNRIPFHGHTYVEMIYTGYYYADNYLISDSLIGYFRNDTVNKQTLFYSGLTDTSFFAYNFNQLIDGTCSEIDTILVNGQRRTRWTYGFDQYPFGSIYMPTIQIQYVEGIGGLNGLIPVYHPCGYLGLAHQSPYVCTFGNLTCFSICGQTIYPNDASASCLLISGLSEIVPSSNNVKLFPTLNHGQFQVDVSDGHPCKLIINDVLGREVLNTQIGNSQNFVSLKNAQAGIYLWRALYNGSDIQTGKFIVTTVK